MADQAALAVAAAVLGDFQIFLSPACARNLSYTGLAAAWRTFILEQTFS